MGSAAFDCGALGSSITHLGGGGHGSGRVGGVGKLRGRVGSSMVFLVGPLCEHTRTHTGGLPCTPGSWLVGGLALLFATCLLTPFFLHPALVCAGTHPRTRWLRSRSAAASSHTSCACTRATAPAPAQPRAFKLPGGSGPRMPHAPCSPSHSSKCAGEFSCGVPGSVSAWRWLRLQVLAAPVFAGGKACSSCFCAACCTSCWDGCALHSRAACLPACLYNKV